jgi:regulator of protease activity HflC (stomatin/prohibitin superfamily)
MKPGINFKIPIIERIAFVVEQREQVIDISSQVAVTKDNVALHIDAILYVEVEDPYKAAYNVEAWEVAICNLAQTTMRSEIGKITLDKTFEEREHLNKRIVDQLAKDIEEWGIKAIRYEIRDIEPPNNIQKSMILQAEAERSKRAAVLASEGSKISEINIAEAKKQAEILQANGLAESQILKAKAQAEALRQIDEKLSSPSGMMAAQFLLGQRYIDALTKQARKENTFITKVDLGRIKGNVHDALDMIPPKKED